MTRIMRYHVDAVLSAVLLAVLGVYYLKLAGSYSDPILIIAAVLGTAPVFWSAVLALREREWASMDMLASIALAFSLFDAQWASAVFIALMLAAARILDDLSQERMEKSIKGLLKLRPTTAKVERDGKIEHLPIDQVKQGDIVVIDLGDRIPVDGTVVSGDAAVDESSLTGESLPVEKEVGSKAFSSTLVASGSMHIQTDRVGKDTTLEHIISLVESARAEQPKIQTLGEMVKKYNGTQRIISKIERKVALDNLDSIIAASDAIMVARGDLGNEIPLEEIPFVQKTIITKSNAAGKPVITATQMMLSMTEHDTPTRAEVTDVEEAIMQGSDAVMLSEESANGKYPVETVAMMERILVEAEKHLLSNNTHAL